jgi:hypothetical protein
MDPLGLDGWGNDLADWLDANIDYAQRYWQYGDHEWWANGVNNTIGDLAHGAADMFRVGSGTGHAIYDADDNGYGRLAGIAQDIARAAAIFNLLGGPSTRLGGIRTSRWPSTAPEMDKFLSMEGTCIPDLPSTPGRGKVVWKPSDNVKIVLEQHPYHPGSPPSHAGPHWHLSTPGKDHIRYLPGDPIP